MASPPPAARSPRPASVRAPGRPRRGLLALLVIYAVALAFSHLVTGPGDPALDAPLPAGLKSIQLPAFDDNGPVPDTARRLVYAEWTPDKPVDPSQPVVVLVHGSPGSQESFGALGPQLAAMGHRVIAMDLPGFGRSSRRAPSYSIRAHAHAVIALMERLDIERAHLVGFSLGGGVILYTHEVAPERSATLTFLASIGTQENEGSGSYHWEHTKYGAMHALTAWLPEAVPHFGLLPPHDKRLPWSRNFWDTDQRPLREMMRMLDVPVLVLHGINDPLVAPWAAREHAELIPTASLVMTRHSHFLPFLQPRETATWLDDFFDRHARPGVAPAREFMDLAPVDPVLDGWFGAGVTDRAFTFVRTIPWWGVLLILALLALSFDRATAAGGALLAAPIVIDFVMLIAALALSVILRVLIMALIARVTGRATATASTHDWARRLREHPVRTGFACAWRDDLRARCGTGIGQGVGRGAPLHASFVISLAIGSLLWGAATWLGATMVSAPIADAPHYPLGAWSVLLAFLAAYLIGTRFDRLFTTIGRRRAWVVVSRVWRHEFWPSRVAYAPLALYIAWLSLRHRNPLVFTCVNPGIANGGGAVGESKGAILGAMRLGEHELPVRPVPAGPPPTERARTCVDLIRHDAALRGYPVILKPDAGFKGHAVKLVRTEDQFEPYFRSMRSDAILQRFHPGPGEAGIFWVRNPNASEGEPAGRIFSVTLKSFTEIVGDGRRTLEELVYRDNRLRMQASTVLERHAADASRVLDAGERVRVANAGNHAQGTLFRDGAHLVTPQLEAAIDRLARSMRPIGAESGEGDPDSDLGGLDFGRFDVRYESEESLKRGEGLGIVELNGATGESTNIYDPKCSLLCKYRILFEQWRVLYELGAWRRARGARPMRAVAFLRTLIAFERGKTGSRVAD